MAHRICRREFLTRSLGCSVGALAATGGLGSLLAACGGGGSSTSTKTLSDVGFLMTWVLDSEFGGEYLAKERGFYEDANLNVTIMPGGPNVIAEPLVVSNKAFAALSEPEYVAAAVAQGAPIKIVAAHFQRIPWAIMSLASKPIKTPQDMIGKKIGVPALDEVAWTAFLKLNKIDPSQVPKVRVQFDPAPLVDGEVDGWLAYAPNEPVNLKVQGIDTFVFLFEDYGYHEIADVIIAHEDTLKDKDRRAQLVNLVRADIRGWQEYRSDPEAGAKLAVNTYGTDLGLKLPIESAKAKAYLTFLESPDTDANGLFWMSDEAIAKTVNTMQVSGLDASPDLFTRDILEEAYQGKTSL